MTTGADEARDLVVTNTLVVRDVVRSVAFYRAVPSAAVHALWSSRGAPFITEPRLP